MRTSSITEGDAVLGQGGTRISLAEDARDRYRTDGISAAVFVERDVDVLSISTPTNPQRRPTIRVET